MDIGYVSRPVRPSWISMRGWWFCGSGDSWAPTGAIIVGRAGALPTVTKVRPVGVAHEQIPAITPQRDRTTANPE